MLKTLDILIGLSTVMLLFSMAVTVVTQFINQIVNNQGRFLRNGLAGLLRQLDPGLTEKLATNISTALLKHPLIADTYGRIGSVIQRQELTALLMELASAPDSKTLGADAKAGLIALLKKNGIDNPEDTIGNIRDTAMHLEATHPELASDVRQSMAILKEARTDLVGKLNAWFDQTIDRVSQKFTHSTRWITLGASLVVAVSVQLDVIALVDRLSLDDSFRGAATKSADDLANVAAAQQAQNAPAQNGPGTPPPAGGTPADQRAVARTVGCAQDTGDSAWGAPAEPGRALLVQHSEKTSSAQTSAHPKRRPAARRPAVNAAATRTGTATAAGPVHHGHHGNSGSRRNAGSADHIGRARK